MRQQGPLAGSRRLAARRPPTAPRIGCAALCAMLLGCGPRGSASPTSRSADAPSPHGTITATEPTGEARSTSSKSQFTIYGLVGEPPTAAGIVAAALPATISARLLADEDAFEVRVRPLAAGAPPVVISPAVAIPPDQQLAWTVVVSRARQAAAITLGASPRDHAVEIKIGRTTLPPADHGVLIASMIAAALTGRELEAGATVIGSIGGDGIIGAPSLTSATAASLAGLTAVGVPRGHALKLASATAAIAAFDSLADAVGIATGSPLPRPMAATTPALALGGDEAADLARDYVDLRTRQGGLLAQIVVARRRTSLPPGITDAALTGAALATRAETSFAEEHHATALAQLREAVVFAETYACAEAYLSAVLRRDATTVNALLAQSAARIVVGPSSDIAARLDQRIGSAPINSVGDALRVVSAYESWHEMLGYAVLAETHLGEAAPLVATLAEDGVGAARRDPRFERAANAIGAACLALARQDALRDTATQRLEREATTSATLSATIADIVADTAALEVANAHEWANASIAVLAGASDLPLAAITPVAAFRELASAMQSGNNLWLRNLLRNDSNAPTLGAVLRTLAATQATSFALQQRDGDIAAGAKGTLARARDQARRMARFARGAAGAVPLQARLAIASAAHRDLTDPGEARAALAEYRRTIAYAALAAAMAAD